MNPLAENTLKKMLAKTTQELTEIIHSNCHIVVKITHLQKKKICTHTRITPNCVCTFGIYNF